MNSALVEYLSTHARTLAEICRAFAIAERTAYLYLARIEKSGVPLWRDKMNEHTHVKLYWIM
jgi:hypothetical protein